MNKPMHLRDRKLRTCKLVCMQTMGSGDSEGTRASTFTSTVVPATRGHCRFGAKVSPRGRWQVPRGRDRHFDTHIYGHTSIAHIVYALLMHTQTMSESNENRDTPITCITTCSICRPYTTWIDTIHQQLCANALIIYFKQMCTFKCNLDRSHTHARTHARTHTHGRQETWREVALGGKNTVGETSGWAIIRTICVFPQAQPSSIATARHE